MSVMSLALTYAMQIYNALQRRNSFGLALDLMTDGSGDAAILLKGLGPRGKFDSGSSNLAQLSDSMANLRETHEFYPVLFYFRFSAPRYAVSRMVLLTLDAVSLIRSAIAGDNEWLRQTASVTELWNASMTLAARLEETFIPGEQDHRDIRDRDAQKWRERYFAAVASLREAGIDADGARGAEAYIAQRSQWQKYVRSLAAYMEFPLSEIDPVTETEKRKTPASNPELQVRH
jgi:hypothetical protein